MKQKIQVLSSMKKHLLNICSRLFALLEPDYPHVMAANPSSESTLEYNAAYTARNSRLRSSFVMVSARFPIFPQNVAYDAAFGSTLTCSQIPIHNNGEVSWTLNAGPRQPPFGGPNQLTVPPRGRVSFAMGWCFVQFDYTSRLSFKNNKTKRRYWGVRRFSLL